MKDACIFLLAYSVLFVIQSSHCLKPIIDTDNNSVHVEDLSRKAISVQVMGDKNASWHSNEANIASPAKLPSH